MRVGEDGSRQDENGPGRRTVLLVALSATALLVGCGLDWFGTPPSAVTSARDMASSAIDTHPAVADSARELSSAAVSGWSDLLVNGGAGFLVAFAAGYCLRSFLKVLLTVVGSSALILIVLGALDVIEPDYEHLLGVLGDVIAAIPGELDGFAEFASGRTSMLLAGALGLLAGWLHD